MTRVQFVGISVTVKDVTVGGFGIFVRARFVNNFEDEDICVACDMRSVCSSCPWQTPQVRKLCNQLITNDDISFGFSRERIIYRILFPCSLLSLFASHSSLPLLYLAVPLISVL